MARGTNERSNRTFIKIVNGKFAESVNEDHPKAVKRYSENKQKDVYEVLDDFISGRITGMELRKGDYGWELLLNVRDVDESYQIQIQTNNQYFTTFANKLPNINLNQDVHLEPYAFNDKEKKKPSGEPRRVIGMTVKQGGEKIMGVYGKDNPIPGLTFPRGGDDEDIKMYYMQEEKFYRALVQKHAGQFATESDVKEEMDSAGTRGSRTQQPQETTQPIDDGLPF